MNDEQEISKLFFRFEDCDGNTITKQVSLPWDTTWPRIIYEVAKALDGYGYIDVVNRIQVKDLDDGFIPLSEEVNANCW